MIVVSSRFRARTVPNIARQSAKVAILILGGSVVQGFMEGAGLVAVFLVLGVGVCMSWMILGPVPGPQTQARRLRVALGVAWFSLSGLLALTAVTAVGVGIDLFGIVAIPTGVSISLAIVFTLGDREAQRSARVSAIAGLGLASFFGFSAVRSSPDFAYGPAIMALFSLAILALSVGLLNSGRPTVSPGLR